MSGGSLRDFRFWLVAVLALAWLTLLLPLDWIPHDDGALAQAAERVLNGEVPHRDFDELYSGGLTFIHALAFRVLGVDLLALRLVLLTAFALWLPVVHSLARRFVPPWPAAGVTLLAAVWSAPVYPAPMPSWYNLFLATAALWALQHWLESRRWRWAALAGAFAALSIAVKVSGVFLLAGLLLALALDAEAEVAMVPADSTGRVAHSVWVTVAVIGATAATAWLLRTPATVRQWLHLMVPILAMLALLSLRTWHSTADGWPRTQRLLAGTVPLIAGLAGTLVILVGLYALADGDLRALARGVFVLPARRIGSASLQPPEVLTSLVGVLPFVFLAWSPSLRRPARPLAVALVLLLLAWLCYRLPWSPRLSRVTWASVRMLLPLAALMGLWSLRQRSQWGLQHLRAAGALAVVVFCGLIQYPFTHMLYFAYVAPLLILALGAIWPIALPGRPAPALLLGGFALLFGLWWAPHGLAAARHPRGDLAGAFVSLELPRARIRVSPEDRRTYMRIAQLVRSHSGGNPIFAFPDSPEIYFLTEQHNPTRVLFDFLSESGTTPEERLAVIQRADVQLIVHNIALGFSPPSPPALVDSLAALFPHSERVGDFDVRWRQ